MNVYLHPRSLRRRRDGHRRGVTLIELLMVLLIISLLLSMVTGGIMFAVENARKTRNRTQRVALASALQTYRHEYGDWPGAGEGPTQGELTYQGDNWKVFNPLLDDPRITFLEAGQFLSVNPQGERLNLATMRQQHPTQNAPIVDPWGRPYKVTIDLDKDTVSIENLSENE